MSRILLFTVNFLLFAGVAFVLPFLVLYYQSVGFSGTEIGLLTGLTPLLLLFGAPLWTGLADATRRHRLVLSVAFLGAVAALFAFPLFDTFVPILVIALAFFAFYAPIYSFADSAAMYMLADRREMYGRVRVGGTIGFGLAALAAGALAQSFGLWVVFWGCAVLWLAALVVSQKLVFPPPAAGTLSGGGMRALWAKRGWRLFMVIAFAGGLAFATTNNYLLAYMQELGASEGLMGLTLSLGTLSEIPVLFFGNRLLRRFSPYGLLLLAMGITGVRLLMFALAGSAELVLAVQLLNGLTFPAMWVAGVAYAEENAPAGMSATAQGMFGAMVMGFGAAVGGFVGGPLLEGIGGRGLFWVFGAVVLVIVAGVAWLENHPLGERKSPPAAGLS